MVTERVISKKCYILIMFQLTVTTTLEGSNNEPKTVYNGILMSWGVNNKSISHTVHLPYYLERGEQRVGATVKCTLNLIFDCIISQYTFSQVSF